MAFLANQLRCAAAVIGIALLIGTVPPAGAANRSLSGRLGSSWLAFAAATQSLDRASAPPTPDRRMKTKARLLAGAGLAAFSLLVLAVALALVRAFKR